jgi:hypothetical protein
MKSVVRVKAQASDVWNFSIFKKNKCKTSEIEKATGMAILKILTPVSSFLK